MYIEEIKRRPRKGLFVQYDFAQNESFVQIGVKGYRDRTLLYIIY